MQTYITLNVALAELHLKDVEDYLQKALGEPSFIGVAQSETGRTLVVQYKYTEFVFESLARVTRDLGLDYITYRVQDGSVIYTGVASDYAYTYTYAYNDFVEAHTCTYTKAEQVEQAYDVTAPL